MSLEVLDRVIRRTFAGGEQSPNLDARADLRRWHTALQICENFVTMIQGGATRRSGTVDVHEALEDSVLIPFAFSADDGFAIEFGVEMARFFRDYAILTSSGTISAFADNGGGGTTVSIAAGDDPSLQVTITGTTSYNGTFAVTNVVPGVSFDIDTAFVADDAAGAYESSFELETPFTADDIAALDYTQSADVLFLSCGNRPIQKLSRLGTLDWTLADLPTKLGPFMDENGEDGITLSTDEVGELEEGDTFTLIADADLFVAAHVGALWKISVIDRSKYEQWAPGLHLLVGAFRYWGDHLYKLTEIHAGDDTSSGSNPPVHTFGEEWDGPGGDSNTGYKWKYLHSGWGVVKVITFTDATHVEVTAQTYVPRDLEDGTWRWAEGAWSDHRGFPRVVAFHEKRFIAASTRAQPIRVWASVIDDFPNFRQGTLATDGWAYDLQGASNKVNVIRWLVSGTRLSIGTAGDEFAIPSSATREVLSAVNVKIDPATEEGSYPTKAVKIGNPVFVSADGKRVHELTYDFSGDVYQAPDLTIFADHMSGVGSTVFQQIAWQRDPYRLLWTRRSDGVLACATYRKDQEVNSWHRHLIAGGRGAVKSICIAPSENRTRQDLWMIVEYADLEAGAARRVQALAPFFERGDLDVKGAWFVDCGFEYNGAPITSITGIPAFLEGETVKILADGKVKPSKVVTAGAITLATAASKVILGLGYTSKLKTLRYDRDAGGGQLAGKKQRVASLIIDLLRAASVKFASNDRDPEYVTNEAGLVMDASARLMTGATNPIPVESGWDEGGVATIVCEDPLPATIRAITIDMQVAG